MKRARFFTPGLKVFVSIANVFFHLLMLPVFYVGLIIYLKHAYCVVLPNGYMIGHVAVFKLEPDVAVDVYLRDPNGRLLLRTDSWVNLDRVPKDPNLVKLSYPGGAMEMDGRKMIPLILDGYDFAARNRMWNEPDPQYPNSTSIIATDLWGIYLALRKSRDFEMVNCGTPWFDRSE
ncbi:MAG: hypothetical protein AAF967_08890 [Pseudomonadota bacterium]